MPNLPLPKGLPKMPKGMVYLGLGRSFKMLEGDNEFEGHGRTIRDIVRFKNWGDRDGFRGNSITMYYCAPKDSEIAKLNQRPHNRNSHSQEPPALG